ncbi:vimentin-type intermediate filament-associated coiled-coil protein-like [Haliotis cracherodii]|uniref:vimentin-type intermediate filament-associated coiled-coil protein-like n=1 Tax=Haliotis cracherodii TaxID=6455 RepID=UPI0039E9E508
MLTKASVCQNKEETMSTMIPRTSIDEANRHLLALHRRVNELENTVQEQNNALLAKDELLRTKVSEVEAAKNSELAKLSEKLVSTEKTVEIIQEQLRQKHQQVAILQRSCRLMQNLVSFKNNVKEMLSCMDDAEKDMASQRDFLSLYTDSSTANTHNANSSPKSSGVHMNSTVVNSYANHEDTQDDQSMNGVDSGDDVWKVRQGRKPRGERKTKPKGKEFYL